MITEDQKQNFIELRAMGYSFDKISKKIRISKPTLIKLSKELDLEIKNYSSIYRESLMETYQAHTLGKLESLGKIHRKLMQELEHQEHLNIDSSKLIELIHKNLNELTKVNSQIYGFVEESEINFELEKSITKWSN